MTTFKIMINTYKPDKMTDSHPIKLNTFDVNNITTSAPKLNLSGGKNINTNYDGSAFILQTPRMLSFGINKWDDPKDSSVKPKLSVTLSFMGMDSNPKLQEFHQKLVDIDNWAVETAGKNSWEWLSRKNLSRETLDTIYTHCIKVPLDSQTGEPSGKPHSMKVKLQNTASGISCAFFTKEKTSISSEDIEKYFTKGSHVRALIQCTGIWVAAGKFGLSWKLVQIIVEPRATIGKEYAFDDSEEPENNDGEGSFTLVKRK